MTKLSVNLNKFATMRNARGGNNPDVVKQQSMHSDLVPMALHCILVLMKDIYDMMM
jgi:pyridoxine 5'-phosphate synthase PdxJ